VDDEFYFDGDPATESTRRHMERVLTDPKPRRRWPWVAAAMTGMALLGVWQFRKRTRPNSDADEPTPPPSRP